MGLDRTQNVSATLWSAQQVWGVQPFNSHQAEHRWVSLANGWHEASLRGYTQDVNPKEHPENQEPLRGHIIEELRAWDQWLPVHRPKVAPSLPFLENWHCGGKEHDPPPEKKMWSYFWFPFTVTKNGGTLIPCGSVHFVGILPLGIRKSCATASKNGFLNGLVYQQLLQRIDRLK